MSKTSRAALAAACFVLSAAGLSRAAVYDWTIDADLYGHVDQNSPGITDGPNACGPTSVYNSFVYLKSQFGVNLPTNAPAAGVINEIGIDMGRDPVTGGTVGAQGVIDGKKKYIHDHGFDGIVSVESLMVDVDVTGDSVAQFIYDQLKAGQDVEIGFLWSRADGTLTGGGHIVTINGIDYDTATDMGTIDLIDPIGGTEITGNLTIDANQQLIIGYTGGGAGDIDPNQPDDNPGDAGFGKFAFVAAESVVPEPGVAGFVLVGAVAGTMRRTRR